MGKVGVVCPWGRGHMRQAPGLCLQMGVACRKGGRGLLLGGVATCQHLAGKGSKRRGVE